MDIIEELKRRNLLLTDAQKERLKADTLRKQERIKKQWINTGLRPNA